MLTMNEDLAGALEAFILLLKEEKYFEAHEVLEEAWHPLRLQKDPLALLLKGMINAAIAFEHLKRNRPNAKEKAKKVMVSYLRHRALFTPSIRETSLFSLAIEQIETLRKRQDFYLS
jgi:hypothetical protein